MWSAVALILTLGGVSAQLTAQSSVAPELRECYTNATLVNRNNLPPTTMRVLIDIIRKIEDHPNVNMDLRQLAVILLHTYRQDGIEYHQPETTNAMSNNVLPFAPTFHSFHRHRLLLTRIIPNNLQVLGNETISSVLKCSLHNMLSTTVDARVRGDENNCNNQMSQYRAQRMRMPRDTSSVKDDVEILDPALLSSADKNGQFRQYNPNNDVEYTNLEGARSERQLLGESQCPLMSGVVRTTWGAVSAGNLIAGIAAGAQLQQIPVLELTKGSVLNYPNVQSTVTSIYPATLSGDIAEAVLIQGTERGNPTISIGAAGSWNSSQASKHYMLHSRNNIEMADPEIRGDIDGFVLGSIMSTGSYNSLKLSQILDMYYSDRNGVLSSTLRACNRRELSQQYITNTQLVNEAYTFAAALDTNMPLRGTITGGLDEFVTNAVSNFQSYTTSNLNDLSCVTTEATSYDYRLKTNLYLVLDSTWQYQTVYPAISYLLDSIEVDKYGSSITLLSAFDGSVVINKTFSLADFHSEYTQIRHQTLLTGVNLENTLTNIRIMMHNELQHEKQTNYVGGNSTVLLFLINSGNLQNNAQVWEQARILNETVPDLRILFATSTNQFDNLWNLVRDMHNDIRTVSLTSDGTNLEVIMAPILERIQQVGRRVVNSNCGSEYLEEWTSGTRQFDDFVEPGYINFYSINPNYFYINNDNRKVRITRSSAAVGSLVICHSRVFPQPRQNSSNVGLDENIVECQTLATTGNVEISLQNACNDYYTINSCPPLYVSVQSVVGTGTTTLTSTCTDNACRFPYNTRYQVQIEEFGCFSGAKTIGSSLIFTIITFVLTVFRWM